MFRPSYVTPQTKAQLDLQIAYLQYVHYFCYYSHAEFDEEMDLKRRCGVAVLRPLVDEESDAGENEGAAREVVPMNEDVVEGDEMDEEAVEQTEGDVDGELPKDVERRETETGELKSQHVFGRLLVC